MGFDYDDIFTLHDAEKEYKSSDIQCKDDNDCPDSLTCFTEIGKCHLHFYCLENDHSVCLHDTDKCEGDQCDNGRFMECYLGFGKSRCGFSSNEECTSDDQCLYGDCVKGKCGISSSKYDFNFTFLILIIPILLIIILLSSLIYCCCKKNHKKDINEIMEYKLQPIEGVV